MDKVQPCNLLSRNKLKGMHVIAQPKPFSAVEGINMEGRSCLYTTRNSDTVTLGAATNQGADWMGGAEKSAEAKEMQRIRGFRTIKEERKDSSNGPHDTCTLYVDVASGQSLQVEVGENSDDEPPTCRTARRFAEAAMKTLTK